MLLPARPSLLFRGGMLCKSGYHKLFSGASAGNFAAYGLLMAAPAKCGGTLRAFRRGRTLAGPHFGRPGVPPPTETFECPSRAGLGPAPTTYSEAILSWFGWGRPLSLPPSIDHVPLARHSQAQKWSRTRSNFPQTQGPMARKEPLTATQILRAGNVLLTSRGNPRNGGPGGKRSYGHEVPVGRVPR